MSTEAPAAPSLWRDPADAVVASIVSHYERGARRNDLSEVEQLRTTLGPATVPHRIAVVGTNGKTSTATYIARLLSELGVRTGLYTSPHLASWTERILIDGAPCPREDFLSTLERFDDVAQRQPEVTRQTVGFFDVLTLTADHIFERFAVDVAVFESGIGGRLDATRVLSPEVVALTSVGYDHQEILGETLEEILLEKLAVAPAGAAVVTAALDDGLARLEREWAAAHGVFLEEVASSPDRDTAAAATLPRFQRQNLAVAERTCQVAVERFGLPVTVDRGAVEGIDLVVAGRFQRGNVDGVEFLADTGHNVSAWRELAATLEILSQRFVAVVAVTIERDPAEFADALARAPSIVSAIATTTRVRAGHSSSDLRAALAAATTIPLAVSSRPEAGFAAGLKEASERGASLLVTGSTYLVADFLAWCVQQGERSDGNA